MPVPSRARARRPALLVLAAAAAAALLLVATTTGAAAQGAAQDGNVVIRSSRRDAAAAGAALATVEAKQALPLATRRGCATPDPTPSQVAAMGDAVRELRAQREAAGQGASASAFRDSLVGKAPTVVDTYFHVVYPVAKAADLDKQFPNGTYGGDDFLARQMDALNAGYNNTGFQFKLAGTTRTFNAQWANAAYGSSAADAMFRGLRKGGYDALNFFVVYPPGGLLGYATFPVERSTPAAARRLDGVVLHYMSLPSRPGEKEPWAYARGETAVHEAGHWFGLLHTFQDGCEGQGDMVDDTPAEAGPTFGCIANAAKAVDTCPNKPGVDSIHNYMSYSDDACLDYFSPGQIERLNASFNSLRRGVKVQRGSTGR